MAARLEFPVSHLPRAGSGNPSPASLGIDRSSTASSLSAGLGPLPSSSCVPGFKGGATVRQLTEETETSFGVAEERFVLKELLGEGSFGSVYRCTLNRLGGFAGSSHAAASGAGGSASDTAESAIADATDGADAAAVGGDSANNDRGYAVKVIDATRLSMLLGHPVELVIPRLTREIEILHHLGDHPRILKMIFAFFSPMSNRFYLVTELLEGGELFHAIVKRRRPFNESDGRKIFSQIVDAVAFCHSMGVAHRDLKLENCIFERSDSLNVKLCDYGQAKMLLGDNYSDTSRTLTTTPVYTAPEVASAVQAAEPYDAFKADSFGLGVILYGLLCSALPNAAKGLSYERHQQWSQLSEEVRGLTRQLLHPDPTQRPKPEEVKEHLWVKGDSLTQHTPPTMSQMISPMHRSSGSPSSSKILVETLLAVQQFIVGIQRERGTCCWALGSEEGESAYHWQVKYSDERLDEASALIISLVSMGDTNAKPWIQLSSELLSTRSEMQKLRASCNDKVKQRDDILDGQEEFYEAFDAYTSQISKVISAMDTLLTQLRGWGSGGAPTPQELRLKLLQMTAEQLGRERAFFSGHLAQPETLRLAKVVRKLAEIVGARQVFLGSTKPSRAIVASETGLLVNLRLTEVPPLDWAELSALEAVEEKALTAKKISAPVVAECWFHLTKGIDKVHQHIMVSIVDFFAQPR